VVLFPPPCCSPPYSSSHFTWCFSCVLFSVWPTCLINPIFLVGVRMVAHLFHSTFLKEVGNLEFNWSHQFFLVHGRASQFGLESHLKKIKLWPRTLLILWFYFTKCSLMVSLPLPCCFYPSSTSHPTWCFPCVLISVWSSFLVSCLGNPMF